jgi:hypothetical protein
MYNLNWPLKPNMQRCEGRNFLLVVVLNSTIANVPIIPFGNGKEHKRTYTHSYLLYNMYEMMLEMVYMRIANRRKESESEGGRCG